jgi:FkbM family methyltransferase
MLKILFNFPTRERPDRFKKSLDSILNNCEGDFRVIVKLDRDDPTISRYLALVDEYRNYPIIWNIGDSKNKVNAINRDISNLEWDVVFCWADDIFAIYKGFDNIIRGSFTDINSWPCFWDGYRKDDLITMCIVSRVNYDRFGYVYYPGYESLYCDNEMTEIARIMGGLNVIRHPQIVKHNHPALNTNVRFDELNTKNDKSSSVDKKLFEERKNNNFYINNNDELLALKYQQEPLEYEGLIYKYFNPKKKLTIFEVGACQCEDTLKLQKLFPNSDIHAFEPIPDNYNKGRQKISGITLNNIAVSDHKGEDDMYVSSGAPCGSGEFYGNKSSSLLAPYKHLEIFEWCKFNKKVRVKVDTIANYITKKNIKHINFIHMDVQGAELQVLKGCGAFISNVDIVFLEVARIEMYKDQALLPDINDFFISNGFELIYQNVSDVAGNQLWARIKSDLLFTSMPKYCINLAKEVDRRVGVAGEFEKLGLSINFYNAIDGKKLEPSRTMTANEIACSRSHRNIIKEAKRQGLEYVYICEDDIKFCDDFWKRIRRIESCGLDYDMLFLGGHFSDKEAMPIESSPTIHDNIYRVYRLAGAYSYIVKSTAYDKILNAPEKFAIDALYCYFIQKQVKAYAFIPFLTTCAPCFSNITGVYMEYPHVKWYYSKKIEMITYTKLGKNGRLGNQLFQVAAAIAIAKDNKTTAKLPVNWQYRNYFNVPDKYFGDTSPDLLVNVSNYHYDISKLEKVDFEKCVDLFGYFQSEKYFKNIKKDIIKWFTPKVARLDEWSVGMHIRRGDFVGNKAHINLKPEYYISAIDKYFNDPRYKFYICTDDPDYARFHFKGDRFIIADRTELEDFDVMVSCQNHILANSSFSWWGAYLAQSKRVIRPAKSFRGVLDPLSEKDLWQPEWITHEDHRIDLSDVTFITTFKYDHPDRIENLDIFMDQLGAYKTNILIGEMGGQIVKEKYPKNYVDLNFIKVFHHTRSNNILAALAKTEIVINIDCDIVVPPNQIYEAVKMLRNGYEFVFPYEGIFVRVGNGSNDRNQDYIKLIKEAGDIGILKGIEFFGMSSDNIESHGGVFGFRKGVYFKYGGDNENYVSYAPEDTDRAYRFRTLSKYGRVSGSLYHLNHFCGVDSTNMNPYFNASVKEWGKVRAMNKKQLLAYIKTWEWDYSKVKTLKDIDKGSCIKTTKNNITDVTFIIPVKYDHPDRKENLNLCISFLRYWFDTNIIIGEQGGDKFSYVKDIGCEYVKFDSMHEFHRTQMINKLTSIAKTPIVFNWDADVVAPPNQVLDAVNYLRNGGEFAYPYNGTFIKIDKDKASQFGISLDISMLFSAEHQKIVSDSDGGAIGYKKDAFFRIGGENEHYMSHSPEDRDRKYRIETLAEYTRIPGPLFHINHYKSKDSIHDNQYKVINKSEWRKVGQMSKAELTKYIKTWKWI